MSVTIELTYLVCRWCGCVYGLPTELSNRLGGSRICPNGHNGHTGHRAADEVKSLRRELDASYEREQSLKRQLASVRGVVSRMRASIGAAS
jgi:hypothetical protein